MTKCFFVRVRKTAKSDYKLCHVCLSARSSLWNKLGSHWTNFHEILRFLKNL